MRLSLAGWSLQKLFQSTPPSLTLLDFPAFTRDRFGIDGIELNNIFFASRDGTYLAKLREASVRAGTTLVNIAVDEQGDLSHDDPAQRELGLRSYAAWIPIARELGIDAIRANSGGAKLTDRARAVANCTDSFKRLADIGREHGVRIMMENHWGLSMDPRSMVEVLEAVRATHGADQVGALADFGNWDDATDRYAALRMIMPLAMGVHAKVNDIDEALVHPRFDHARCLDIARECGYDGWLGIEFEGEVEPVVGVERGVRKLRPLLAA